MTIQIPKTDKDYILMVNRAELYEKALELGYDAVIYPDKSDLDDDDIKAIEESGKFLVCVFYSDEMSVDSRLEGWYKKFHDSKIKRRTISFVDEIEDEDRFLSLNVLADKYFMTVEHMERYLESEGYIPTDDYENKCGNCHKQLRTGEKYCKYCGTKRGEGAFLPYTNSTEVLYGAPIKIKKKCKKCGNIWIEYEFGRETIKYCPKCGDSQDKTTTMEERRTDLFFSYFGSVAPYDAKDRPKFLTEDQVISILNSRKEMGDNYNNGDKEVAKAIDDAGIKTELRIKDDIVPKTEAEADMLNLVREILKTSGMDTHAYPGVKCPHCGSSMIAAIDYGDEDKNQFIVAPKEKDPVKISSASHTGLLNDQTKKPAFLCMCCSEEFSC